MPEFAITQEDLYYYILVIVLLFLIGIILFFWLDSIKKGKELDIKNKEYKEYFNRLKKRYGFNF